MSDAPSQTLTRRQREVLAYLLDGKAEKQIAYRLRISVHTVHSHIRKIYESHQVHSQTELMARLLEHPVEQNDRLVEGPSIR
jgi:DNA-binding NarL/FixJ family response regulator